MDEVYVVETVNSGAKGVPNDVVVEVAVCRMNREGTDYDTVYNESISIDPMDLGKESLDFLEKEHGITAESLYMGESEEVVVKRLQEAIYGKECTSFDVNLTFGKFLCFEPWDMTRELTLLPPISWRLPRELRVQKEEGVPAVASAYREMCPGDPAGVGSGRRALDLAQMSVFLMMGLRRNGLL